ncbi:MAG: hypothetical protein ACLSHW_02780 [Lachnospiraceae bacterium]
MDMKLLEREGIPFYRAVKEFLKWCGEDALFAAGAILTCWNCSET